MQSPNSLTSLVFKSKYYKGGGLMNAKAGYNSSLVWKSLLEGRKLLAQGLIWRIGNGEKVKIWEDAWIPNLDGTKVYSPINTLPTQALVLEFINTEAISWKEELIHSMFSVEEVDFINSIPLNCNGREDKWVWHHTKNGLFTIRSAY